MIYNFEANCFYDSLSELDENEYQFYRQGCLVSPNKISSILRNEKDTVIIAKKKNKAKALHQEWKEEIKQKKWDKILNEFSEEEQELIRQKPELLFKDWGKFKYVAIGGQNQELSLQQVQNAENAFYDRQSYLLECSSEELDFFIKNWRNLFQKLSGKQTSEPTCGRLS